MTYKHIPMRQVVAATEPSTDYHLDYPPHVRWDLGEECRVTAGRDGDDGPWIVYVGLGPDEADIYCVAQPGQLVAWAERCWR